MKTKSKSPDARALAAFRAYLKAQRAFERWSPGGREGLRVKHQPILSRLRIDRDAARARLLEVLGGRDAFFAIDPKPRKR